MVLTELETIAESFSAYKHGLPQMHEAIRNPDPLKAAAQHAVELLNGCYDIPLRTANWRLIERPVISQLRPGESVVLATADKFGIGGYKSPQSCITVYPGLTAEVLKDSLGRPCTPWLHINLVIYEGLKDDGIPYIPTKIGMATSIRDLMLENGLPLSVDAWRLGDAHPRFYSSQESSLFQFGATVHGPNGPKLRMASIDDFRQPGVLIKTHGTIRLYLG